VQVAAEHGPAKLSFENEDLGVYFSALFATHAIIGLAVSPLARGRHVRWKEEMPRDPDHPVNWSALLRFVMLSAALSTWAEMAQVRGNNSQTYLPTEAARLRGEVTLQNWDDGGDVSRFAYLHTSEIFPTAVIHRNGPLSVLEETRNPAVGAHLVQDLRTKSGSEETLDTYVAGDHGIDGFIVLHHGRIVYEAYPRMRVQDKHLLMSVTKAFIGTAVGILEDQGRIDIHRNVGQYIPALKGTAWESVTIQDVLEMASGMEGANESYTDPKNKHYQYEASLGWQPTTPDMPESVAQGDTYAYLASLKRIRPPGEAWAYTSVNTAILGWLLEETTGKTIADVLSEQIWSKIGAEADAQIVVNNKGVAVAHGGMITTLRDLARFGLLFTPSWRAAGGTQIISERFFNRITLNGRKELVKEWVFGPRPAWLDHVAYQWDAITTSGKFFKGGFGGQILYIAPQKDVVVAHFGTNKTLDDAGPILNLGELIDDLF
jgi:CubicO group peptidase (beta-lactamase class C family)